MKRAFLALTALMLMLSVSAFAQSYTDDFENGIGSFWTLTQQYGSVSVSSGASHTGTHSVQFSSVSGGQKYIFLTHHFTQTVYGKVSVWVFDTGAGVSSSNYAFFDVVAGGTSLAQVYTFDYGFPGNGPGSGAAYDINTPPPTIVQSTGVPRTQAWHQFSIDSEPGFLKMYIDGSVVYSGAGGLPFDQVDFGTSGPSWRPNATFYFDDFSFTPLANATMNGTLIFKELVAQAVPQNVTFTFRPTDGSPDIVQTLAVLPVGTFTLNNLPTKAGVLHIKAEKYLAINVPVDFSAGNVTGTKVVLRGGDANNDNVVDIADFGLIVNAYNSDIALPGSGYDIRADANGDGLVDIFDFSILVNNYNMAGDV